MDSFRIDINLVLSVVISTALLYCTNVAIHFTFDIKEKIAVRHQMDSFFNNSI